MGSKNPKTSYRQKYYFFCQIIPYRAYFLEFATPPAPKSEIFQPLDRQCRLDSILNRPYARNMTFTT